MKFEDINFEETNNVIVYFENSNIGIDIPDLEKFRKELENKKYNVIHIVLKDKTLLTINKNNITYIAYKQDSLKGEKDAEKR